MNLKFLLAFCFLCSLILTRSVTAQNNFDAFWTKFKSAVIKGDKAKVANLTKFPFSLGYDPSAKSGEGYIRTKTTFLRRYRIIFNGEVDVVKCFQNASPKKEGKAYSVACSFKQEPTGGDKPFVYSFTLTKLGWRFAGFENVNE